MTFVRKACINSNTLPGSLRHSYAMTRTLAVKTKQVLGADPAPCPFGGRRTPTGPSQMDSRLCFCWGEFAERDVQKERAPRNRTCASWIGRAKLSFKRQDPRELRNGHLCDRLVTGVTLEHMSSEPLIFVVSCRGGGGGGDPGSKLIPHVSNQLDWPRQEPVMCYHSFAAWKPEALSEECSLSQSSRRTTRAEFGAVAGNRSRSRA